MKRKFTILTAAIALLAFLAIPMGMWGQTTYEQLTSIANIDESAQYVLGIDGTGFHYEGTSSWGKTALPSAQTPIYYTLTKATDGNSFTAHATISGTTYYLQIPTSNTFSMATSTGTNTDIIIGTTQVSGTNYAVANKTTTARHLRINGTSGLRSYAGTTGTMAFFYKVVTSSSNTYTVTFDAGDGTFVGNNDFPNTTNTKEAGTYTLPSATRDGYTFNGWALGESTYEGGATYTVNADADFVATYTENSGNDDEITATLNIQAYAQANSWANQTQYTTAIVTPVTFTANGGGNTGKYYTNGQDWRFYQNESASITISVADGYTLVSVTPTYSIQNGGVLKNGDATIASGTTVNVSGTSVTFTVGNSGSATNGQVRFTNIDVVYVSNGGVIPPSISAENVSIEYDAVSGSIAYTINNEPDPVGTLAAAVTDGDWLTLSQGTASPIAFTCTANQAGTARTATVTLTYTYNREAVTKDVTVTQAGDPNAVMTIAEVRTQGTGNVATKGVVTSCVGTTGYIQDATAAICVYGAELTVGDEIRVSGALSTYHGLLEITNPQVTVISQGNTVNPEVMTIADINASTNQGWYIRIENATVTEINDQNTTIAQGENTIVVRGISGVEYAVNDIISLDGNIGCYNVAQIANPTNVTVQQNLVPTVTVTPNSINAPFAGAEGTLTLTYENIENFISFDYYFCDANGNELEDTDPDYPGDWIDAEINEENEAYTLSYIIDANDGEARTAYMKVYTFDDNLEEVYAIVTVNQAQYVIDYATLPFEWEGGASADFLALNGVTAHGLGSDYGSNNAPYLIKFDGTGDYIQVKTNEQPGKVTIGVKMIGGASTSTITIQGSADGETFTDVEELTISGAQNDVLTLETTNAFAANVRYVRMLFTKGSNVGVGPISIAVVSNEASIAVNPDEVNVDAEEHDGTLDLTYENLPITEMTDFDIQYYDAEGEEANVPDWIEVLVAEQSPEIGEGYVVSYWIMENEGAEARTVYFKVYAMDDETNLVYSNLVTVTQAAPEVPATPGTWVLTSLADLTEDDIFVIVGNNGDTYAMSNDEGTQHAPSTVAVTVTEGTLSGEPDANIQWNLEITDGGYIFHPNGTTETWLYCTNDNNGVRVGTGDAKHFTFDETYGDGYLTTTETTDQRWIGIYNSQDWRCYKLGTNGDFPSNIAGQTFSFYKKVETLPANSIKIIGYGDSAGGYYLIASPFTVNPLDVEGMTEGHFDLFRFNESADYEWENWKVEGDHYHFNLVPGQGYLYAHKTDVTLTFTGTPYNGEPIILSKTQGNGIDWPGWNLVGNPYGVMAYLDRDFYTMNEAGDEIVAATNNSVQAMEGVFVIAREDGEELTFSTEAPAGSGEKIVVNVSNTNGALLDRAMIRFGEGDQLPKFQINENSTKLYINEGEEEFAVVRCINESSTPVSFRPAENGTYTLSINTENVEMEYLHLIDNLTGTDIDLLATPSYTFESNTTDNVDRFAVVYTATTSVNENNAKPFAFFNGSEWVIMNEGNATMQVVDVTGRVISTETLNGNATINLIQVPGVYMIRLVNGNDVKVQKVVVK